MLSLSHDRRVAELLNQAITTLNGCEAVSDARLSLSKPLTCVRNLGDLVALDRISPMESSIGVEFNGEALASSSIVELQISSV